MKIITKPFEWLVAGVVLNFAAYLLVLANCIPAPATPIPPVDPTGAADDPWGQAITMILIGVGIIVAIIFAINWIMKLRSVKLMLLGKLIDMHGAATGVSYRQLWLKRRILRLWKQINPKDKKKSIKAISVVIRAGYGLRPDEMPKVPRETKSAPKRAMPRPANDHLIEWERAA